MSAPEATASADDVLRGIESVARRHLDVEVLDRAQRLVEDLELDSIQLMTLAIEVEDHFRVALDPEDEEAIATVGDLVDVVSSKLEETAAPLDHGPEKQLGP